MYALPAAHFLEERVCCEGFSMALPCVTQLFIHCIAIDLDILPSFECYCLYFCSLNISALQESRGSCN